MMQIDDIPDAFGAAWGRTAVHPEPPGDHCPPICVLVTDLDAPTGGIMTQTLRLVRGLAERNIKSYIICRNYHNLSNESIDGAIFIRRTPVPGVPGRR